MKMHVPSKQQQANSGRVNHDRQGKVTNHASVYIGDSPVGVLSSRNQRRKIWGGGV